MQSSRVIRCQTPPPRKSSQQRYLQNDTCFDDNKENILVQGSSPALRSSIKQSGKATDDVSSRAVTTAASPPLCGEEPHREHIQEATMWLSDDTHDARGMTAATLEPPCVSRLHRAPLQNALPKHRSSMQLSACVTAAQSQMLHGAPIHQKLPPCQAEFAPLGNDALPVKNTFIHFKERMSSPSPSTRLHPNSDSEPRSFRPRCLDVEQHAIAFSCPSFENESARVHKCVREPCVKDGSDVIPIKNTFIHYKESMHSPSPSKRVSKPSDTEPRNFCPGRDHGEENSILSSCFCLDDEFARVQKRDIEPMCLRLYEHLPKASQRQGALLELDKYVTQNDFSGPMPFWNEQLSFAALHVHVAEVGTNHLPAWYSQPQQCSIVPAVACCAQRY